MFKFKIIDSPQYVSQDIVLRLMRESPDYLQNQNFPSKEGVFIIAEDSKKNRVGGAYFLKKQTNELHEDLRDLLAPLSPHEVWECSAIYLDFLAYPLDLSHKEKFLHDLYKKFVEFGVQTRVNFIAMKLLAETYNLTKTIGNWPYVIELSPGSSADGFFYGVLPLTGSQYEAYAKNF